MRGRQLAIALLMLAIACGGVSVRQEFRGVGQPAPPGAAGLGPEFPTMTVTNAEGDAILVEAYSWARAEGSAGSGSRAPERWVIEAGQPSVTLDLPYQGVAVLLSGDGPPESVSVERLGEGRFRLLLPGPGVWEVDLLAISEASYATYTFTVDSG